MPDASILTIKVLPAFYGDCTLVSWTHEGKNRNILIDGGTPRTYPKHLKNELLVLIERGEVIDLLIVTHVDEDHIGGIKKFYEDVSIDKSFVKSVWFNCGNCISKYINDLDAIEREIGLIMSDQAEMSYDQGNTLEKLLIKLGWKSSIIAAPDIITFEEATFQILSPGHDQLSAINEDWQIEEETNLDMSGKASDHHESINDLLKKPFRHDKSVVNGSCISFLLKVAGKSFLLLADAFPDVVEASLREADFNEKKKLSVDVVKVAHHGSKFNNSGTLYSIIDSKAFIVSTDGSRDHMPHKEALARIINANKGLSFFFNYPVSANLFSPEEMKEFDFSTIDLSKQNYTITI
jgi:hypothetical protein